MFSLTLSEFISLSHKWNLSSSSSPPSITQSTKSLSEANDNQLSTVSYPPSSFHHQTPQATDISWCYLMPAPMVEMWTWINPALWELPSHTEDTLLYVPHAFIGQLTFLLLLHQSWKQEFLLFPDNTPRFMHFVCPVWSDGHQPLSSESPKNTVMRETGAYCSGGRISGHRSDKTEDNNLSRTLPIY